jgi:hypothetical protein
MKALAFALIVFSTAISLPSQASMFFDGDWDKCTYRAMPEKMAVELRIEVLHESHQVGSHNTIYFDDPSMYVDLTAALADSMLCDELDSELTWEED